MRRLTILVVCWLSLTATRPLPLLSAQAETPPSSGGIAESLSTELARLLVDLDSDRYALRQRAADRLAELVADPGMATMLSRRFEQVLVLPDTSLEVRKQLERLLRGLPKIPLPPAQEVSDAELDRLVRQLEDDSYGARLAAGKRLQWLLENPRLAYPIMSRLKWRVSAEELPPGSQPALEPLYQQARAVWLASDPQGWNLPPVPPEQIERWIDALAAPLAAGVEGRKRRAAEAALRELRDVLARDAEVPKVKAALQAWLARPDGPDGPPAQAALRALQDALTREADVSAVKARLTFPESTSMPIARLAELVELTRPPAMVAEYWQGRRHLNTQHLLIGVPSQSAGAERPSHFDRIDDRTAHCVSGQNLAPGDHPVGVAIPHPKHENALFYLVNLSTPRLRMAFAYQSRRPETVQLAAISRRTLDRYLERKTPLSDRELTLLEQLDLNEVSRFAGLYFQIVDDQPMRDGEKDPMSPRISRHGAICVVLAAEGTREAIPGLLKALEGKRFLAPTTAAPYQLPWIAALAIAARDPWPEVDPWLAGLVQRTEPLILGQSESPELGAVAAAILLKRQEQDPLKFGLKPAPNETLQTLGLSGHRFAEAESSQKVRQWWEQRKRAP